MKMVRTNAVRRSHFPNFLDRIFDMEPMVSGFDQDHGLPAVNIIEADEHYMVEVSAPGMTKADFKINLNEDVLNISAEKELKADKVDVKYTRKEFGYSKFNRNFTLPETVNGDKIEANYEDGILSIRIPKKKEAVKKAPRDIQVS